ncbi:unnamed protein product [Arctogadus glacialis]
MLFRTTNTMGGLLGLLVGLILTMWVGIGAQIYPPGADKTNLLQFSTNCSNSPGDNNMTTAFPWTSALTLTREPQVRPPLADSWYSLSYLYFCPLGTLCTVVVGLLVSIITGGCKQERLDSRLFVRKSDLICFNCCGSSSKTSDMEKEDNEKTKDKFDAYHKFDTTEKDEEKVTKL